jgi:NAD(P)-dependent dehydrogenase (short-subunit alcohol dehydrogenase family)
MDMTFPGDPPVVLVTGAGQGIGRAIALAFASEQLAVAVNDLNAETAESTAEAIRVAGGKSVAVPADVSRFEDAQRMFAVARHNLGPVGVAVNNAHFAEFENALRQSEAGWQRTWDVDVTGPWNVVRAALPDFTAIGEGVVINIASANAFFTIPQNTSYAAAKAAVVGLTRGLALELGPQNVRVVSVSPGLIATPAVEEYIAALPEDRRRSEMGRYDDDIPLRRIGRPEEIGDLCVYLASSRASFMHGTDVACDGGMWALNKVFSYNP